jgi:hypothetical protein
MHQNLALRLNLTLSLFSFSGAYCSETKTDPATPGVRLVCPVLRYEGEET